MNTILSKRNSSSLRSLRKQEGAATLIITVIIVLVIVLLTYTMTTTAVVENRMTSSDLKSKQAFHAAQAGLDFTLQKIIQNELEELNDTCDPTLVDDLNPGASPTFQLFFGEVNPECPSAIVGLQTKSVVRSIGRSSDGSAVRVLEVRIDLEREWIGAEVPIDPTALPPPTIPSAVVSKGDSLFIGAPEVAVCETVAACQALASPGKKNVGISGLDQTLVTAGGTISGGDTGPPNSRLLDQHKDGNRTDLASMTGDQFFSYIMGADKETFQISATYVEAGGALPDVNVNPLVWHNGDLQINGGVLGSPDKPIALVVDGNLSLAGNVIIWGVVYTTGNDFSAGTSKIFGALVAENNITAATGNSSVYFNEGLATLPPLSGTAGEVATVLGDVQASFDVSSWREIFL
jgi:Tfp pilus assembly protein PilX